jgi:hypothetical protein
LPDATKLDLIEKQLRASFEAGLLSMAERAPEIERHPIIPSHWFSSAASECADTYIAGYFYSSISLCQAYVEGLSKFLFEHHKIIIRGTVVPDRWEKLFHCGHVSAASCGAAKMIWGVDRNHFHHLNKEVEGNYSNLAKRAKECVNNLRVIDSDIFGFEIAEPGRISPRNPQYWPDAGLGLTLVSLRRGW